MISENGQAMTPTEREQETVNRLLADLEKRLPKRAAVVREQIMKYERMSTT